MAKGSLPVCAPAQNHFNIFPPVFVKSSKTSPDLARILATGSIHHESSFTHDKLRVMNAFAIYLAQGVVKITHAG